MALQSSTAACALIVLSVSALATLNAGSDIEEPLPTAGTESSLGGTVAESPASSAEDLLAVVKPETRATATALRRTVSSPSSALAYDTFTSEELTYRRSKTASRELRITAVENWAGQPEHLVPFVASSAFDIQFFAPRTPNDWFLIGMDDLGRRVLTRWIHRPAVGAIAATRPATSSAVGVSIPHEPTSIGPVGGTYLAPEAREPARPVRRLVVSRDLGNETITAAAADPDGRFVLFATKSPTRVWRRGSAASGTKEVVIDDIQSARLASNSITGIYRMQHATYGRCFAFSLSQTGLHVVAIDNDNDGEFDDVLEVPSAEYRETFTGALVIDTFDQY